MPKIKIAPDAELYYEEKGEGPPVMLVPGLGGVGAFWAPVMAALSREFRVITHDHRGCGQSTRSRIKYSVEQMADDVRRLMDALKIEAAHYVGHSTGGAIGQIIAQDTPQRIKRLVLSATWAGHDNFFRRSFATRKSILQASGIQAYNRASALLLRPPAWVRDNEAVLQAEEAKLLADPPDPEILASRIDAIMSFDRRARLGEIRHETLVICAQDDMVTPIYLSEEIAAGIPGAKFVTLDYGGHFAPTVESLRFSEAVTAFLKKSRTAERS